MESSRQRPSEQALQPVAAGLGGDFRRLKTDSTASLAELREFLGRMQGRSPQEVLGEVAKSSLLQCTVLATLIIFVSMAALTLGPYYLQGPKAAKTKPAAAAAAAAPATPANAQPQENASSAAPANGAETARADGSEKSNLERAAEKMELNETKASDPKKNPLDDFDKLLDLKD